MTDDEFANLNQIVQAALAGNERAYDLLTPEEVDAWSAECRRRRLTESTAPATNAPALRGRERIRAALGQH